MREPHLNGGRVTLTPIPGPCRGSLRCSHMFSKVPPPTHILNIAAAPMAFHHCQSQSSSRSTPAPAAQPPHGPDPAHQTPQVREQRPPVALGDAARGEPGPSPGRPEHSSRQGNHRPASAAPSMCSLRLPSSGHGCREHTARTFRAYLRHIKKVLVVYLKLNFHWAACTALC